jgi:hypothetical protein
MIAARRATARAVEERRLMLFLGAFFSAFFLHGLVDYFLKFTPTFLLFWIAAGLLVGCRSREMDVRATRV